MAKVDQQFVSIRFADGTVGIMGFVVREYFPNGSVRWERRATDAAVNEEIGRTAFDAAKLPVQGWRLIEPSEKVTPS